MDSSQRANICTSTTPIILSQEEPGRPACLIQRPAPIRGLEPLDAPGSSFASFIGEFIQLFHSNEAAVDLRSMAESPNCMTYVGFPLVHFSATCSYPHEQKFFYGIWVVGDLQILFGLGQKKIKTFAESFCNSHHIRRQAQKQKA